jgi:hypothetical protein
MEIFTGILPMFLIFNNSNKTKARALSTFCGILKTRYIEIPFFSHSLIQLHQTIRCFVKIINKTEQHIQAVTVDCSRARSVTNFETFRLLHSGTRFVSLLASHHLCMDPIYRTHCCRQLSIKPASSTSG